MEVHGITLDFLLGKPIFKQAAEEFIEFIRGAELVIHNAPFDVGFIDAELSRLGPGSVAIGDMCEVTDTLQMARHKHPGQRNNLDALCQRYEIDNTSRSLHGALLDAEILAEVYLAMTGGQTSLGLGSDGAGTTGSGTMQASSVRPLPADRPRLAILRATPEEVERHEQKLRELDQESGEALWRRSSPQG
jgi:DNA polymerase-3 subunit epsilon